MPTRKFYFYLAAARRLHCHESSTCERSDVAESPLVSARLRRPACSSQAPTDKMNGLAAGYQICARMSRMARMQRNNPQLGALKSEIQHRRRQRPCSAHDSRCDGRTCSSTLGDDRLPPTAKLAIKPRMSALRYNPLSASGWRRHSPTDRRSAAFDSVAGPDKSGSFHRVPA